MTWDLRRADAFGPAGLVTLADDSIGCAIIDPPYSDHVHASCVSGLTASNRREGGADVGAFAQRRDIEFKSITPEQIESLAKHCARIVRRWSMVFSDVESCHLWREAFERAGLDYVRTMAWNKHGGAPQFTGDRPAVGFEAITLVHRPGRKTWNGGGKRGWYDVADHNPVYTHSIVLAQRGEQRIHTTQKPLKLIEALVRDFTEPGEIDLDSHAGSATTLVACKRLGRSAIGFERGWGETEEERAANFAAAAARLEATEADVEWTPGRGRKPKQGDLLGGSR